MFVLGGSIQATTYNYWTGPDSGDFLVDGNWSNGVAPLHVPGNDYWAIMNGGNAVVGSNAETDLLTVGDVLDATCTINAGAHLKIYNSLALGHLGGNGVDNVNGTLYSEKLQLAQGTGSVSTINIGDGSSYYVGWWGTNVGMEGIGNINLDGTGLFATYNSAAGLLMNSNGHIDIEAGYVAVAGDFQAVLQGYINNGWITAYDGTGIVNDAYFDSVNGWTTITATIPEPATMLMLGLGGLLMGKRKKRA